MNQPIPHNTQKRKKRKSLETKYYSLEKDLCRAILLKSFLSIFPAAFFGMESTKATRLIFLYDATWNQEENTK